MLPLLILIAITPAMAAGFGKPFEHGMPPMPGKNLEEKRNEIQEKLFDKTKEGLLNWTEKLENWISKMESKLKTLNMSEEAKRRIEKRIQDMRTIVDKMREKINGASNFAELRNAMKDIRMLWADLSKDMRLIAFEHAVYQLEKTIDRLNNIADRLSEKIDVSNLKEKISNAEGKLQAVKEKLTSGTVTAKDIAELRQAVKEAFHEAIKLIRENRPMPTPSPATNSA